MLAICSLGFFPIAQGESLLTSDGFALPEPGHSFQFPRDYGSHPDFKIEWWYLTGHLFSPEGRRFGFEATFFRQAGPKQAAGEPSPSATSHFGVDQIYLAHMAVSDLAEGRFLYQQRLNREGWEASSARETLEVHNGPWSLTSTVDAKEGVLTKMELRGSVRGDAALELSLAPTKPLVIFGENGVSRKSAEPTAASYYLTFTRLASHGHLSLGGTSFEVAGEAWMDHEISSSQLGAEEVGWDWLGIQLSDKRELMIYRMRRADGSSDPASSCTWVSPEGLPQTSPFSLEPLDTWQSPITHAKYPSRIRLRTKDPLTGSEVLLTIEPLLKNQELAGALDDVPYWEGACRVLDAGQHEIGSAYMELTGYAKALKLP